MNENEANEASKRLPVFATRVEHKNDLVTELHYEAMAGAISVLVPREAVETVKYDDSTRLCLVSELTVPSGGVFRPEFVFKDDRMPMEPTSQRRIEVVDMVEQGADVKNIKAYLNQPEETEADPMEDKEYSSLFMPPTLEEAQTTLPNQMGDVIADGDQFVELPEWFDGGEVAWDGALIAGGRVNKTAPWDFTPSFLPNHVVVDTGEGPQAVRVNKKDGRAGSWTVLNPALASEQRPAGALLGSVSDRYFTLGHPVWVKPMLKYAEMSGIKSAVTSWNEGAKCRVDLDVTQASQLRKSAADKLRERNGKYLDTDSLSEAAQSLDGLYKFGFTINNSLDGRGSFGAYGSALRTYCMNLAVAGGIETALKMRHTRGVMENVDWDECGLNLVNATAELNEWLVNTELMSWIPMDLQLMDKLLTVMEEQNLMTAPRMVKNKETGLITQINRSHMDLAVTQGWKEPTLSYVAVQGDQQKTLYHALQCVTGAMTHKPTVYDDKRELKGSTLGIDTLDNRLKKVNQVFTSVADQALVAAKEAMGKDHLTLSDIEEVKGFVSEHKSVLGLDDVPQYSEKHEIAVL